MSKTLITLRNVSDYIDFENSILPMTSDMMITPSAQDYCRNKLIKMEYGFSNIESSKKNNKTENEINHNNLTANDDKQDIEKTVKQMIRKNFNIVREDQVQKIAKIVLDIIKKY